MLCFAVILCIIVLLTVLLMIPFYLDVEYKKDEVNNKTEIKLKVAGLQFVLMPKENKKGEENKKDKKKKKEKKEKAKEKFTFESFKRKLDRSLYGFNAVKKDVSDILDYLTKKLIVFNDLSLEVFFGFDDAAVNGIMTGVLNGIAYNIIGFIHRHMTIRKWNVNIQPDFNMQRLDMYVRCIVRVKLVHIIVVALKALKIYFKFKKAK